MIGNVLWPPVFSDPLDAPYRPECRSPHERQILAVADGVLAWGHTRLTRPPKNFDEVIAKLSREAGINSSSDEAFMAAAKSITRDGGGA